MPTFQDMQNEVLFRGRQRGVNFGGATGNGPSDLFSPELIKRKLNQKYGEFLKATSDAPPQILPIFVQTVAQQKAYALRPCGNDLSGNANPAAMRLKRVEYTYAAGGQIGQTKRIRGMGTQRFDQVTFQQALRLGAYAQLPVAWVQQLARPDQVDFYPGTAVGGDQLTFWIIVDPLATARLAPALTCAQGSTMQADNDVPLIPDEFHGALVEGALDDILRALDRKVQADDCRAKWQQYIDDALDFGALEGEGESDQVVEDVFPDPLNFA